MNSSPTAHWTLTRSSALSDGNPYSVSELVASAVGSSVPLTVVDAVLSRLRRLLRPIKTSSAAGRWSRRLSTGSSSALWCATAAAITAAEQRGLLTVQPEQVSFRHELTRRAIVDALPGGPSLGSQCPGASRAGRRLATPTPAAWCITHPRPATSDALARYAPVQAREPPRPVPIVEAAAHYALALAYEDRFTPAELADPLRGVCRGALHDRVCG